MCTFRLRSLWALAIGAILAATPVIARTNTVGDAFSGVWKLTVSPDQSAQQAGKQVFTELVLFADGQLMAQACSSYGFKPGDYTLSQSGSSFTATMTTDTESITWTATLGSSGMVGTVSWNKANGHVYQYTLQGVRQTMEETGEASSN